MDRDIYPGLLLQDRYRVVKKLGKGGLAQTWEVDDRGTRKVLKVLFENYPKIVELFKREARELTQLDSPGIPKVEPDGYFTLTQDGLGEPLHCLVMEKIEGLNLSKYIQRQKNTTKLTKKENLKKKYLNKNVLQQWL